MRKLNSLLIFVSTFLWFITIQAQDWETYGYAKYLFSTTENDSLSNENLVDHQLHLRINNRYYPTENLSVGVEFRLRGFYGDLVEKQPQFKQTVITDYPHDDLSSLFWEKKSSLGYGQIDRLFFNYNYGDWQITFGRQRIAWGTSFVWNITDLFNPQSVLDFDYEEMPGSDALRIQYFTGVAGRLELALKSSPNKFERTVALLWLHNKWDYDFYLIAAWQHDKPILATAFAGDIYGAGFRGEFKISDSVSEQQLGETLLPISNYSDSDKKNINAVISLDYTFPNSFYLHSEILYNSIGKKSNTLLYSRQALKAGLLSPSQVSLFFETAYNIHPLVRGTVFLLHNPNDNSSIFVPSVSWSAITNLDLYLIGFITDGDPLTEFGSYGKALFFRTKYSF
ncbi:MAG: hypothetical protein D8M58_15460 [Calditrichaeota bacterium]|nr:MAG: hypothetical protein DWQ03_07190 [Calditrichota bacterium]MBL1206801.1 hypothetical protein [Calditrichota bacterium]NOG46629.1 hypothetical protein [Calditrichota bacterium]